MIVTRQLSGGDDVVGAWSEDASQAERNAVYEALFAILDGSEHHRYEVTSRGDRFRLEVTATITLHGRYTEDGFEVRFIARSSARHLDDAEDGAD